MSQSIPPISRHVRQNSFTYQLLTLFNYIRDTQDKTPKEFVLKDSGRKCKLAIENDEEGYLKNYVMWIDETLVTDLPPAPAIEKEDIPVVC